MPHTLSLPRDTPWRTVAANGRARNHTRLGHTLARALRTPQGLTHLPPWADGWTTGGCWLLARALTCWARAQGWRAELAGIVAPCSRGSGIPWTRPLLQHVVARITLPSGETMCLDGDGAGRPHEVAASYAAEYHVPARVGTARRDRCAARGIDPGHDYVEALTAWLHPTLAGTVIATARPALR